MELTYLNRTITAEYFTEDNRIYIEGVECNGRDVTNCVNLDKVADAIIEEELNKREAKAEYQGEQMFEEGRGN